MFHNQLRSEQDHIKTTYDSKLGINSNITLENKDLFQELDFL